MHNLEPNRCAILDAYGRARIEAAEKSVANRMLLRERVLFIGGPHDGRTYVAANTPVIKNTPISDM